MTGKKSKNSSRSMKSKSRRPKLNGYVLRNGAHHGRKAVGPESFSSGRYFDGWDMPEWMLARFPDWLAAELPPHLRKAKTWLLREGWRRKGLISVFLVPGGREL